MRAGYCPQNIFTLQYPRSAASSGGAITGENFTQTPEDVILDKPQW